MVRYGQGLWVCKRKSKGKMCGGMNPPRARKCARCEKPRPPKRKAKHNTALEQDYERFLERNGGDFCGICLKKRLKGENKLDRDHSHGALGHARGLLCRGCNLKLGYRYTSSWLRAAADYLDKHDPGLDKIPF